MKPSVLERSFADFVLRNGLISASDGVVAAVSGGIDSMVLLDLLRRLRASLPFRLSVAHVNHGLRGPDSDADEAFVREAAGALGVPFLLHRSGPGLRGAPGDGGIQERARRERYEFFLSLCAPGGGTRVATAHHRDDNAETVLFNFLRGSGINGLAGIPVAREDGSVVRPLLFATRAEIRGHALDCGLAWREDATNAGTKYTRNAVRHDILPLIAGKVNPGIRETLHRTSLLFTDLAAYVRDEVERRMAEIRIDGDGTRLDAGKLLSLPPFLRESVILTAARSFSPHGIGFAHVRTLLRLLDAKPGSACLVLGNLHATRERDALILRSASPRAEEPFDIPVAAGESYAFARFNFSSEQAESAEFGTTPLEEYVDADRLGGALRLRSWADGDWFVPFGMRDRKKVSDLFVDRKIEVTAKRRIPILTSGGDIVWICGIRLDDRFRVTPATRRIIRLRFEPAEA